MLHRTPLALPSHRYRDLCRAGLTATLFLAALFNGSVSPPYAQATGCLAALLALFCLPVRTTSAGLRRLVRSTALILTLPALWGGMQVVPLPIGPLTHPVWQQAGAALDLNAGYISLNPLRTLAALPALILPGLVFLCTLLLCQSPRSAKRVWVALSLTGTAIVLISMVLEVFFPQAQVFTSYPVSYGSFSGVFVNRNVAASFFGLTAFALAGSLQILKPAPRLPRTGHHAGPAPSPARTGLVQPALWLLLFAVLIAIIATRSRAGALLSLPLLVLCLAIVSAQARRNGRTRRVLLVLGGGCLLLVLFGEPVFSRLGGTSGDPRWCAWAATLAAIRDNLWTGTGFGTFVDVFPGYRDPVCLGTEGSWHRAHNSYLELTLGFGLPAALLLLGLSVRLILKTCLTGLRLRTSLRAIPVLTLGALAFVSTHSLVDFPLQIPSIAYYCAALLGAGCAISLLETQHRS
ncbi:O-antigen ligase [Leisingera sp. M658]|uniref:O-antigen ligase family protein n=1 Tax=Leisingera sp. M658 TaxID=2867015 RepID=UPI0021A58F16|nr:O-antigen ligase family protein [Leisingera sp. M658]UWQ77563.1 O-antigen ligase family protein [Leisingera sp. M658]